MRCFERTQPTAAEAAANGTDSKETVYSDVPEESEEKAGRITWFRGIRQDMGREKLPRQKAVAVSGWQEVAGARHPPVVSLYLCSCGLPGVMRRAMI